MKFVSFAFAYFYYYFTQKKVIAICAAEKTDLITFRLGTPYSHIAVRLIFLGGKENDCRSETKCI